MLRAQDEAIQIQDFRMGKKMSVLENSEHLIVQLTSKTHYSESVGGRSVCLYDLVCQIKRRLETSWNRQHPAFAVQFLTKQPKENLKYLPLLLSEIQKDQRFSNLKFQHTLESSSLTLFLKEDDPFRHIITQLLFLAKLHPQRLAVVERAIAVLERKQDPLQLETRVMNVYEKIGQLQRQLKNSEKQNDF